MRRADGPVAGPEPFIEGPSAALTAEFVLFRQILRDAQRDQRLQVGAVDVAAIGSRLVFGNHDESPDGYGLLAPVCGPVRGDPRKIPARVNLM